MRKSAILALVSLLLFTACMNDGKPISPFSEKPSVAVNGNGRGVITTSEEDGECRVEIRLDTDPCPLGFVWHSVEECYWQRFDIVIREFGGVHVCLFKVEMTFNMLDGTKRIWNWTDLYLHCKMTDGTPGEVRLPGEYFLDERFDEIIVTVEGQCEEGHSIDLSVVIYSWHENPICYY